MYGDMYAQMAPGQFPSGGMDFMGDMQGQTYGAFGQGFGQAFGGFGGMHQFPSGMDAGYPPQFPGTQGPMPHMGEHAMGGAWPTGGGMPGGYGGPNMAPQGPQGVHPNAGGPAMQAPGGYPHPTAGQPHGQGGHHWGAPPPAHHPQTPRAHPESVMGYDDYSDYGEDHMMMNQGRPAPHAQPGMAVPALPSSAAVSGGVRSRTVFRQKNADDALYGSFPRPKRGVSRPAKEGKGMSTRTWHTPSEVGGGFGGVYAGRRSHSTRVRA